MRYLLLILLSLTCFATPAYSQGVKGAEERVVELPEDAGEFYLTVFGDAGDPFVTEVTGWFGSHGALSKIRNRTRYNVIPCDSAMYRERYAGTVETPSVLLQAPDGSEVSRISPAELPLTPEGLHAKLAMDCNRWHQRCRPQPQPQPAVKPEPKPEPAPKPTPVVEPTPVPRPQESDMLTVPVWLLVVLGFAGAGVGVLEMYRTTHRGVR